MLPFERTVDLARLRRRIESLRRALHRAHEGGEALTGARMLALSKQIDALLNEYLRLIERRDTA